jgi:hypothetical protein
MTERKNRIMEVPKNIYKKKCINPLCKKDFECDNGNRKYCEERCKRNHERDQKKDLRLKQIQDQTEIKKNAKILESIFKTNKFKVTSQELLKRGFNKNYMSYWAKSMEGELILVFNDYCLHKKDETKDEYIITMKKNVLPI